MKVKTLHWRLNIYLQELEEQIDLEESQNQITHELSFEPEHKSELNASEEHLESDTFSRKFKRTRIEPRKPTSTTSLYVPVITPCQKPFRMGRVLANGPSLSASKTKYIESLNPESRGGVSPSGVGAAYWEEQFFKVKFFGVKFFGSLRNIINGGQFCFWWGTSISDGSSIRRVGLQ